MSGDTKIVVYYGPLSWFQEHARKRKSEGLLESVFAHDELLRELRVVMPPQDDETPREKRRWKRPKRLVAESGDYASLKEHVITNFPGLLRALNPKELHLHNPPAQVHAHLERTFAGDGFFSVKTYDYPAVTRDTLVKFNDGFEDHLVGQPGVRESLLAALYPLTRASHEKPTVVMFYGPSGVGKTETAQFINGLLGGTLMRKQFSMFHNDKFASYVFGGGHAEASFARDLLDRESGVILIDEFDKANSVFHSAFYQLFDGGVFEDKNYRVDIGRALIVCTSNYASEKEIRDALGDALYSRFDALVGFKSLSKDEVTTIIGRLVDHRFKSLEVNEKRVIDAEFVKQKLHPVAGRVGNIRKLGKLADEIISMLLVQRLLSERSSSPDQSGSDV
ncbi:AAA family ATPase [Microbacterium maritypicum]|uniref:AAA family ATPase n=1 Tax=Microbacterium maritypicum TaxID=33918 RepID=UPI0037F81EA5